MGLPVLEMKKLKFDAAAGESSGGLGASCRAEPPPQPTPSHRIVRSRDLSMGVSFAASMAQPSPIDDAHSTHDKLVVSNTSGPARGALPEVARRARTPRGPLL